MPLTAWLELAATLDVDGVELYPTFLESYDSQYLRTVATQIGSLGLEMPMLCHSPDFTHPDERERARQVEFTLRMIEVTRALGGRFCRVLSGQRHPEVTEGQGIGWAVASLERLLPAAEAAGVVLTIENHYKDGTWEYPEFAQSRERFLRILEKVPSPWLRVQYDPSNAVVAGIDPYALLDEVLPRVATMHASDRYLAGGTVDDLQRLDADPLHGYAKLLRHGVIGEGFNDFDRIFGTLAGAGFDGWVSIEDGEGDTVEEGMDNLRRSADYLRVKMAAHFAAPTGERLARGMTDGG
ncbi:MAG: sugar phosphate isomerase/epimerase [Gemmatimonadetes bacterium]|nr:sugar phosphate isomerase/epimerase [Gemmatimonadota bacterium]